MSQTDFRYQQRPKENWLKRFFWFCSGSNIEILRQCPKSEHIKFTGIGATVFFTGLLASVSGGYAFYTAFYSYTLAIFFGALWGLIIFNLDRFIVSTLKKDGSPRKQFSVAIPRILLAILLAIVISKPLELKIFESEILAVLADDKEEKLESIQTSFQTDVALLEGQIEHLKEEVSQSQLRREKDYQDYKCECDGTCGTGKVGRGSECERKEQKYLQSNQEYQEVKALNATQIIRIQGEVSTLKKSTIARKSEAETVFSRGLVARLSASSKLPLGPSVFLMLLILMIEISPMLAKILAPRGPYDEILKREEQQFYMEQLEVINRKKLEVNKKVTLMSNIQQAEIEQEVNQKKEAMRAIADAHLEIVKDQIDEWLRVEKEKIEKRKE